MGTWAQTQAGSGPPSLTGFFFLLGLAWLQDGCQWVFLFMHPSPVQLGSQVGAEEPTPSLALYSLSPQGDAAEATQPSAGI